MQQQEHPSNNFKDGQKINARTFKAEQDAIIYQQAKHTASLLNDHAYGLLPALEPNDPEVKLFLSIDSQQQVQVRLKQCKAITRGGYYVDFKKDTALSGSNLLAAMPGLSVPFHELKGRAAKFYIVITVDPYNREVYGLADPLEQPARIPYARSSYYLSLLPEQEAVKNVIGLFQFPVGKLIMTEQKVLLDDEYIPPCSAIGSHDKLLNIRARLELFYATMETQSLAIIRKIRKRKQPNEMAAIIQKLCENITPLIASHITQLKTLSLNNSPVELVCMLSSFARTVKNTLDSYIDSGYENLMKYFNDRCGVNQAEIEDCIKGLSNHTYNHLEVNCSFKMIQPFTQLITALFIKLENLDYIGDGGPDGWVIREEVIRREPEKPNSNSKFSFSL